MTNRWLEMRHFFATSLVVVALLGCARSPVVAVQQEPVVRVLVVPVASIDKMHTENKGMPLGVLWQSIADRIKSSDFNERMETARKDMGPKLTTALIRQLTAQGYEAQTADGTAGDYAVDALAAKIARNIRAQAPPAAVRSAGP
jgi:hypothetical protein